FLHREFVLIENHGISTRLHGRRRERRVGVCPVLSIRVFPVNNRLEAGWDSADATGNGASLVVRDITGDGKAAEEGGINIRGGVRASGKLGDIRSLQAQSMPS